MRNLKKGLCAAVAACMSATIVWGLPAPPDDDMGDHDIALGQAGEASDEEECRYSNEQVMLVESEYVFDYEVQGARLVLRRPHGSARLDLERLP